MASYFCLGSAEVGNSRKCDETPTAKRQYENLLQILKRKVPRECKYNGGLDKNVGKKMNENHINVTSHVG
jgi:disulfide oxidoreductase YuzD